MYKDDKNFLIAVSYYGSRNQENLINLLSNIKSYRKHTLVVINSDKINDDGTLETEASGWKMQIRKNTGMNIGAWNHAFQKNPNKDYYFFLQDECYIKKNGFIESCIRKFQANQNLAMLGESLNLKWNKSWKALQQSPMNWVDSDHVIEGKPIPRVLYYQETLKKLGIEAGNSGLHLRSLCWAFKGSVLRKMNGFPEGTTKGECIAIEIGVSRKVAQLGYDFAQLENQPFNYIGHREWRADGSSKI